MGGQAGLVSLPLPIPVVRVLRRLGLKTLENRSFFLVVVVVVVYVSVCVVYMCVCVGGVCVLALLTLDLVDKQDLDSFHKS